MDLMKYRLIKGISRKKMSEHLKVGVKTLYNIEFKRTNPRLQTVILIEHFTKGEVTRDDLGYVSRIQGINK